MRYTRKIRTIIIFLTVSIFLGCSAEVKYKLLSFVFDGVPKPVDDNMVYAADTTTFKLNNSIDSVDNKVEEKQIFIHLPYKNKECNACHDQKNVGKLISEMPDVCYSCHIDYNAQHNVLHGPVAGGFCNSCHSPHSSTNKNLLINLDDDLCLGCHEQNDIRQNIMHQNLENYNCITCHDAHGGENFPFRSKVLVLCVMKNLKRNMSFYMVRLKVDTATHAMVHIK